MENAPKPAGPEKVVYEGKMFEVIRQPMKMGTKLAEFEFVRRSPGVRLLIVKNGKILMSREYRFEHEDWDYRLPGGKIFDTLEEFKKADQKEILRHAEEAAERECREEMGIVVKKMKHIYTTSPTASIIMGLYYFLVEDFEEHKDGQELEEGEVIHPEWKTFDEVKKLCLNGSVKEEATVAVLLKFLLE